MTDGFQRFIRDVGWSSVSLVVSGFIHFILRTFLARYLGADDLGLYSLAFVAYSFGLVLSGFGIGSGLLKYAAQYKSDTSRLSTLLSSGYIGSLAIGSLMGIILYFASPILSDKLFHMTELTNPLRIIAFAFPFIAIQKASLGFLNGLRRMRVFATINVVQNILVIIFTIMLVVLGYGVDGAIFALVTPVVVLSLYSLYPLRGFIAKPDLRQHKATIGALFVFGLYVLFANIITATQGQIDTVMLGYYTNKTEMGYYASALVVAFGMRLPSGAVQMVTSPMIATYWANQNIQGVQSIVNRMMKLNAVFIIPAAFVVGFFAPGLSTSIFGDGFAPAAFPLQILLIGTVFGSIQASIGTALSSTAFVNMLFRLGGITLIIGVVMNILLISRFGIIGAAIANSATTIAAVILNLYFIQSLIKIKIDWWWFVRLLAFTIFLVGVTWVLGLFVSLYICVPIALLILMLVIYKSFMSGEDITALSSLISKLIRPYKN